MKTIAGALLVLALCGCGRRPEFKDELEELAYLRAQANTTPAQYRRLQELAKYEANLKDGVAVIQGIMRQKYEEAAADHGRQLDGESLTAAPQPPH